MSRFAVIVLSSRDVVPWSQPNGVPVLTVADADRVMVDRQYAERVGDQIMEVIFDLEKFRGTRRLFVP